MKNKLGIIRFFGKIVQFVRDLERSTVFTGIWISLAMAYHDLKELDNWNVGVMVKVSFLYPRGLEFEFWSPRLIC